jgi:dihydroorotate dehydrogenase (NAD+) catalytic subunit
VYEISKKLDVPVIGCGGAFTWEDVVEYMLAGASAVQFGSALVNRGEDFFTKVTRDLEKYSEVKGLKNIGEIRGLAHKF